jgi:purine-nucleoside/S-methyl-5'-thioadenosine phosphorylase / adenosine deaminase
LFRLDSGNAYRAQTLEEIPWLDHGFGTRLASSWPDAADLATVQQIHSGKVLVADRVGCLGEGDALISNQPGLTLSVRTADCLPILMADTRNRAVAAVHAGWRGTLLEIVPKTIEAMKDQFGTRPDDLVIAIGPGIGPCCFDVGPEVASQFSPLFPERSDLDRRTKIDLVETNLRLLGRNDGRMRQIATSGLCTCCRADLFHSYRRDRDAAGRMVSAIRLR